MRFLLVHGGFHGAWCWDLLLPELEGRGHTAIAIDLPGHGARADEYPTMQSYRDAVVEVLEPGDVLVGHSMGGFITTIAADAAVDRVSHIVYLAAGLPIEGKPMATSGAEDALSRDDIELVDDGRRMMFRSPSAATAFFYHDCSPELAAWACDRLTPQPLAVFAEPISVPRFWAANLPRSFIRCRQDRAGNDAAVDITEARLGVESLALDTSHSPFLSQPSACASTLIEAVSREPVSDLCPD
jgi:pimeloyl-ACP methyl ester carboxylesterase